MDFANNPASIDNKKTRLQLLQNFFDACSIPRLTQYDNGPLRKYLLKEGIDCMKENICFRDKMDVFRSTPICKDDTFLDQNIDLRTLQDKCPLGENDVQTAERVCTKKIVRAAKVVRLHDMQEIPKHFINTNDYKIIYLVRDPRGLINSRLQVISEKHCPDCIEKVCDEWNDFLKQKDTIYKYWKNLMIIRYEDFAVNPETWMKKIYEFIGAGRREGDWSCKNQLRCKIIFCPFHASLSGSTLTSTSTATWKPSQSLSWESSRSTRN